MKVRWNEASLRLRITPSELAALGRGEEIGQRLPVTETFAWSVAVRPLAMYTALTAEGQTVLISLAAADLAALAKPDVEGVYFSADAAGRPRYYIEKDFPCTHPRSDQAAEVEAETFPGPARAEEFEINGD